MSTCSCWSTRPPAAPNRDGDRLEVEQKGAPGNGADPFAVPVIDAHSLAPDDIFALLASLGGRPGRSLVVACEPADTGAGMGLSEPVQAALPHAVRAVEDILREHRTPNSGKGD